MVDMCIVLEDDDVPTQSFFPFCKEMLDRYEHDERVWMVAGFNSDEQTTDVSGDYFFTSVFSIWGWASWKRVIDTWDADYRFMDDPHRPTAASPRLLKDVRRPQSQWKGLLPNHFLGLDATQFGGGHHAHAQSNK